MAKIKNQPQCILVIGGAGYIGSHMVRHLLTSGYHPVVFDNLSSGQRRFVPARVPFVQGDLRNYKEIARVLRSYPIQSVMHFASSIIVPESVTDPLKYYENNVLSFIHLIRAMRQSGVGQIIFSSTAAVYATPKKVPIPECAVLYPASPYGRTKLVCEEILRDTARAHADFAFVILRYFNVAGAHAEGGIGECHEPETHLIPIVLQTALGKRKFLPVYGEDYPTPDGTCIRDYIHVEDLCLAHEKALEAIRGGARNQVFNLGSAKGYSVKQVIEAAKNVTGREIAVNIHPRRNGDVSRLIADSRKARDILGWTPQRDLQKMIFSAWAWEKNLLR